MLEDRVLTLHAFLEGARALLPPAAILFGEAVTPFLSSTSGHRRRVPLLVRPTNAGEVQALARLATACAVTLYPISKGRNWGLGSRLPGCEDCVILDLGGLDRIKAIDERFGIAVIEPGVTQAALADALAARGSAFFLDVTGSGRETSVLGNTLERGVAYNSLRAELVQSLEVVLADGSLLRTGFAHYPTSRLGGLSRFAPGPDLSGLFVQSNLGIVVGGAVALLPRPERQMTFMVSVKDEARLPAFFDALRALRREGTLSSVVHVGNRRRSEITLTPLVHAEMAARGRDPTRAEAQKLTDRFLTGRWSAIGSVMGPAAQVRVARRRIARALGGFGAVRFLSPGFRRFAKALSARIPGLGDVNCFLCAVDPLLDLTSGRPTDAALHSTYWPHADKSEAAADPDRGPGGIVFAAPVVPLDGAAVREAVGLTYELCRAHGFEAAITLNLMNDRTLEGVVSIDFRRDDPENLAAAHRCLRALNQGYVENGFTPYRVDIDSMDLVVDPADPFWATVSRLKQALDPAGVVAPGRYCPP
ncbi:4-cresol dehydrogenase [Rhodospirillum rubrum]|nr:4-cresol dehydrogenase [Rhodospirillum rubrum]MBK1678039.1 4-cresol dehydrogenase [Rhodospirillum rubrum]